LNYIALIGHLAVIARTFSSYVFLFYFIENMININ